MRFLSLVALALVLPLACLADTLTITPTTTLAAQTSNNTSAASNFVTQKNGNLGAQNISKQDVHTLLYEGANTKIYAHLVLWFGQPDHINIGYSSTDAAQVKRQINDMISRGIDGVMMVWYGPNNAIDRAAQLVRDEAEAHPGFTFALMIDHGAILWDSCAGCNPQEALTQQMEYLDQTYFSSPAYLHVNGQPVVTNFDIDLNYTIDWSKMNSALNTKPAFLFQNNSGFSHAMSHGSYSWVMPTTTDYGMKYLSSFYQTGNGFPSEQLWGASYKGFDDRLASWGANRIMQQRCGQTWLDTFSKINGLYNSSNQLSTLQLVTWNDYEEGTEIESGIDNCVSISASVAGNSLQWKTTGQENTLNNYTVYVSTDGQNLMPLGEQSLGTSSLDLCSYPLATGKYKLFVQAVGKPAIRNQISQAVSYAPTCTTSADTSTVASNSNPSTPSNPPVSAPVTTPVNPPASTPVTTPSNPPASTPVTAPVNPPASTPVTTPSNPPASTPVTAPVNPPVSAPVTTPSNPPASTPVTTPVNPPVSTPVTTPSNPPVSTPVTTPVNPPVSAPVTTPSNPPASTPVTTPVNPPVSAPVTTPVSQPVTTPTPGSTPSRTPQGSISPISVTPTIAILAKPSQITIPVGTSGTFRITVAPQSGAYRKTVSLACSNLPLGASCNFSPETVVPGANGASSYLTVSTTENQTASNSQPHSGGKESFPMAAFVFGFPLVGMTLVGTARRKKMGQGIALSILAGAMIFLSSCGGTSMAPQQKASRGTYTILITATSDTSRVSIPAQLTVK